MSEAQNRLRIRLDKKLKTTGLSLRKLGDATGVSFATLSRFLRGKELTTHNAERINAWLTGRKAKKRDVVHSSRLELEGHVFLVTIEKLK